MDTPCVLHLLLSELFLLCLTDPDFTLALVQSEINATTKQCGGCAHFGVKIKGTDFLNGPGGGDP